MRTVIAGLAVAALCVMGGAAAAADVKDQVKVETLSVGLHPGMDPGLYVCAGGHLHIRATVENLGAVPLGKVQVQAKAYDGAGKLLGTAAAPAKPVPVAAKGKSEVNIEFLTITGPTIQAVKRHELTVVEAAPAR